MSEFSELLREYRKRAGLTQRTLADLAGVDQSHLNRVERGFRKPPKPRTIIDLANAMMLDRQHKINLLAAAGYDVNHLSDLDTLSSLIPPVPPEDAQIFSSPFTPDEDLDQPTVRVDLDHPTVQLVRTILSDESIPLSRRRRIAEQISSFTAWLIEEAKQWEPKEK